MYVYRAVIEKMLSVSTKSLICKYIHRGKIFKIHKLSTNPTHDKIPFKELRELSRMTEIQFSLNWDSISIQLEKPYNISVFYSKN